LFFAEYAFEIWQKYAYWDFGWIRIFNWQPC